MGSFFSKLRRKRKLDSDKDSSSPKAKRVKLCSPSKSSTKIGYEILFHQGRDADIEVVLLKKTWKLHKSFLQQSPYFMKLLGENSEINKLRCSVSDPNIDSKSLELCFGFLYGGPLDFIRADNVVNILATAKFLDMSQIVEKVGAFLIKHANIQNAVKYLNLAQKYELQSVSEYIYQRLLLNLIPLFKSLVHTEPEKMRTFLREIDMDLLTRLVKDPDLIIVKDEYDVYLLIKKWVAAKLTTERTSGLTEPSGGMGEEEEERQIFATEDGKPFLDTPAGRPFAPLFELLDLANLFLVSHHYDVIKADNLLGVRGCERGLDEAWKTHVNYYDACSDTQSDGVDRNITPLQRVRIIRHEKYFTASPSPFRLFKRFTSPLSRPNVAMVTLNGFVFSLAITTDNTLEMKIKVKPDVPHILIPTLLYLRFTIFDMNSIWDDDTGSGSSQAQRSTPGPSYPSSDEDEAQAASVPSLPHVIESISGDGGSELSGDSPDVQWRSNVFTGSDLMYLLPYPPAGLSRVLYDLPSGYYERIRSAKPGLRASTHTISSVEPGLRPSSSRRPSATSRSSVEPGFRSSEPGRSPSGTSRSSAEPVLKSTGGSSWLVGESKDGHPNLHVFVTLKMIPHAELKAAKLL